jgi:hypothetical protein
MDEENNLFCGRKYFIIEFKYTGSLHRWASSRVLTVGNVIFAIGLLEFSSWNRQENKLLHI